MCCTGAVLFATALLVAEYSYFEGSPTCRCCTLTFLSEFLGAPGTSCVLVLVVRSIGPLSFRVCRSEAGAARPPYMYPACVMPQRRTRLHGVLPFDGCRGCVGY